MRVDAKGPKTDLVGSFCRRSCEAGWIVSKLYYSSPVRNLTGSPGTSGAPNEQFTLWDKRHKQGEEIESLAKFGHFHCLEP